MPATVAATLFLHPEAPDGFRWVEFTVPMEGPRTAVAPKGVSRRPGTQECVADAEADRLVAHGMALEVDDKGVAVSHSTQRQAQPERAVAEPRGLERAVSQPVKPATTPGKSGASGK